MKKILAGLLFTVALFCAPLASHAMELHIVHSGDTLWKISKKYGVKLRKVIRVNPQIKNPDMIYPGEKIRIPSGNTNQRQLQQPRNVPKQQPQKQPNLQQPKSNVISSYERKVVKLTNKERTSRGLQPLTLSVKLSKMAGIKAKDMRDQNYFSHQSPTYGSPFQMMKKFGISFTRAAENIAAGQRTPKKVVNSWMHSKGHRRNILNPKYTKIGVGYVKGGSYGSYWTQEFIKP